MRNCRPTDLPAQPFGRLAFVHPRRDASVTMDIAMVQTIKDVGFFYTPSQFLFAHVGKSLIVKAPSKRSESCSHDSDV